MRTSIILARKHGADGFELLHGPEVAMDRQSAEVRSLLSSGGVHDRFAEVEHWSSDGGLQRRIRMRSPEEHELHLEQMQKDNEAHQAHLESLKDKPANKPEPEAEKPAKKGKGK